MQLSYATHDVFSDCDDNKQINTQLVQVTNLIRENVSRAVQLVLLLLLPSVLRTSGSEIPSISVYAAAAAAAVRRVVLRVSD